MAKFHITVGIQAINGTQVFEVEAKTKQQALKKYNQGKGDILCQEIEVTSLADASLDDVILVE